jgi:hypothetical protein
MTNQPKKLFVRCCPECGENFSTARVTKEFCKTPCRMDFHNRRRDRGSEIYDILMTCRFDRDFAAKEGLVLSTILSNLAGHYRNADKSKRDGRKSWDPYSHRNLPLTYDAEGGDNR